MGVQYNPGIVTDGLVMCLDPADQGCIISGSTTATDLSGNLNSGSLNDGKVGKDAAGSAKAAVSSSGVWHMDGTDYITVSDTADFTFGTGEFALEMWLKASDWTPNGDGWNCPLQISSDEQRRNGFFLFYTQGGVKEWRMECNWNNVTSGEGLYTAIINMATYGVSLNKWFMVTISRQAEAVFKQYIDGKLIQTTTTADGATDARSVKTYNTDWPSMAGDCLIGNYRTADNHEFQGEIGPVRIYKGSSLSDEEVLQNYNAQRGRFGV